jgi:hypothetical protein
MAGRPKSKRKLKIYTLYIYNDTLPELEQIGKSIESQCGVTTDVSKMIRTAVDEFIIKYKVK